jgi:hypothetical protein
VTTCRWTRAIAAVVLLCVARPLRAQVSAVIDGGFAHVTYDGFLPSGAASLSTALRIEDSRRSLTARAAGLRFESGNHSIGASLNGNAFTSSYNGFRGEVIGATGLSSYRGLTPFRHLLGRTRLHHSHGQRGTWLDAGLGRNYLSTARSSVRQFGSGGWLRHDLGTLSVSAMRTWTGDTSFTDAEGAVRMSQRYVDLDMSVGARGFSSYAGRGVYGEISGTIWIWRELGVVVSGGRYPSDPARGSIAGRYASVSMRFGSRGSATERGFPREIIPPRPVPTSFARPVVTALDTRLALNGWRTFRIQAAGARHVEMMGDFTEWQPVALGRAGEDIWEVTLPVGVGVHKFNVRVDGGEWTVPLGHASQSDDFGGIAGILVIQ